MSMGYATLYIYITGQLNIGETTLVNIRNEKLLCIAVRPFRLLYSIHSLLNEILLDLLFRWPEQARLISGQGVSRMVAKIGSSRQIERAYNWKLSIGQY